MHLLVIIKNEKYLVQFESPEVSTTLGLGTFHFFLQYVTIVFFSFFPLNPFRLPSKCVHSDRTLSEMTSL